MNNQRTSYSVRHKCLSKQHVSLDSDQLSCGKKWAHTPTAVGLMASHKAVRPAHKHFVVCFDNITSNASILVLNGFLAVISYCNNLDIP